MGLSLYADARLYQRVAIQRLDEARLIREKLELWSAAQYLAGYAVECMFKALIISLTPVSRRPPQGSPTVEWLKHEFGHDLGALRLGMARCGAQLPRRLSGQFVFVRTWNPNNRYRPGPGDPEEAAVFLDAVDALVKWASERI